MDAAEVFEVLDALDEAGVRHWIAGGWGVAALAGRQTRQHRDLDLAVDAADFDRCLTALGGLGYVPETDWMPIRLEVRAPGDRWVDLHPVVFDENGHGRQAGGPNDGFFDYPPDVFSSGVIAGRGVPCLSERQQRIFHSGYEPRPQDLHDLAQLDALPDQH